MHPHLQTLRAALASERRHAAAEHRRLLALPWEDRVTTGVSWPPVQVEALRQGLRTELDVRAVGGGALHDGISSGEPVVVAPLGRPDEGLEALAIDPEGAAATLALREPLRGPPPSWLQGELAVTRRFDPSTFERYAAALEREDLEALPLAQALLGEPVPPLPDPLPALPDGLPELNAAQAQAARIARAAGPLAAIHGPPGTGKTTLIVALLRAWVAERRRVMALADSNAAVDHLALRAAATGLRVLRLGSLPRISRAARPLSADARVEAGPYAEPLRVLQRDIDRCIHQSSWGEARSLIAERRRMRRQAFDHEVQSAEVIACTLGSLTRFAERLPEIEIAVVDEATQALEPGIWCAVPWTKRLVLLGDPYQLGPVVTEPGNALERSLLERLLEEGQVPMPALEVQHRMHQDIQGLVSDIYGPGYRPHPAVAQHALVDLIEVTEDPMPAGPVLWVDTAGAGFEEQVDPASRSLFNPGEARLVEIAVRRLLASGLPAADIGVIAPYSAQVHRLRSTLPPGVEVNTINAFQGREAEAIVVSWVRSNPERQLGFVADGRRLTVALTRARRALVMVGDGGVTLSRHPRFAALLERLWETGAATTVWEPPWDAALAD